MQYYDLQKIRNFINTEIDTIERNCADDTTVKQLKELDKKIEEKIKTLEENKRLILDPLITQQFYALFGGFLVVPDERKGYYLCIAIQSVIGLESVKKVLKEHYGDKYDKVMKSFNEYFKSMAEIRNNIDAMREDEKIRNNITHPLMKRHFKLCQNIPMIYKIPFNILGVLSEKTNLSSMKVPKDAMRIYEMEYKKPSYTLEKKNEQQQYRRPNEDNEN